MPLTSKICKICSQEFVNPGQKKYCSLKCRNKRNNDRRYEKCKEDNTCSTCLNPRDSEQTRCKKCRDKYNEAWRRQYRLKHLYNLNVDQWEELKLKQNNLCAICNNPPTGTKVWTKKLALDHDHTTGKVRGLLCTQCNLKLGWYELNRISVDKYLKNNEVE